MHTKTIVEKLKDHPEDEIDIQMSVESVSNKEALKDKIHEIHNHLRNHGAGYGMGPLKVFNILYGLKKIEENGLLGKVNLKHCEFSNLLKMSKNYKDEQLSEFIFGPVLDSIGESDIRYILFYEIPKNMKSETFAYLLKEIDKITEIEKACNVLLSGKIYEYFIGRDETAISELGAYFTDRHIVDYILKKLDPVVADGVVPSMIDMFGGSGGFTTGYIQHLNEKCDSIDWQTEINSISHFDMNDDVIKSAGLEFFCLTGVLPNMEQLKYKNSFTDEFDNKKYKYPLTNPPYGGDKTKKSGSQDKREKVKAFLKAEVVEDEGLRIRRQKQLKKIEAAEKLDKKESEKSRVTVSGCSARIQKFAKDHGLKGNDKESCSLMLLMDMVEVGGTAIGVLKEGVFFNKTYKDLRRCLVENFRVREVISVPQDQFENTSTKTSILIFDNEGTTGDVVFRDLVVEKYAADKFSEVDGDVVVCENKGDICGINDTFVSMATRAELLGNSICSLNGKDYTKKKWAVGDGYKLVNMNTICEFKRGKQLSKELFKDGEYPVIGGGIRPTGYHNDFNMPEHTIVCSSSGENAGFINRYPSKVWASDCFAIIPKNIDKDYLYYILLGLQRSIFHFQSGSGQPHIYPKDLEAHIKIPIPTPNKLQAWVDKISTPYNEKNEKEMQIKELELSIQKRINEIGEYDGIELGSFCKFISGKKRNTTEGNSKGLYPLFSSSLTVDNWIDEFDYNEECIIMNTINGSGKFNLQHSNKFCATSNTIIFNANDVNLTLYVYYYCLNHLDTISQLANGSTKKKMGKAEISKFMLKIPKNKQLIQSFESTFQEIETLKTEVVHAELMYQQYIRELTLEAIPENCSKPVTVHEMEAAPDYKKMKVADLKQLCKDRNIRGTGKTKDILIAMLTA
jgi:hypothetical protein